MELCRLCNLEADTELRENLFNENIDPPLWRIIVDLANLTILESDPYTKIVCFQCFDQLQKFHNFKKMVLYTDWKIRHNNNAILNSNLEQLPENMSNHFYEYCPVIKTEREDYIPAEVEDRIKVEKDYLKIENQIAENDHISKDDTPIGGDYKVIIDHQHKTKTTEELDNNTIDSRSPNGTNVDGDDKYRYDQTKIETTKICDNGHKCAACNKTFLHKGNLNAHLRVHAGDKPYQCTICGKQFSSKHNLEKHLKSNIVENQCKVCYQTFSARCTYREHLKQHLQCNDSKPHTNERWYQCGVCYKTFLYHSKFISHLRIHTGEKPFKCNICDRRFSEKNSLKIHLRVHTGEKPCQCDTCGQRFTQISSLQKHLKFVHNDRLLHECKMCCRTFLTKRQLLSHSKEHLKSHPCTVCDKSFSRKRQLRIHLRVHTGEKPYQCDHCEEKFSQKSNLQRHLNVHGGEKPYHCNCCGRQFSRRYSLQIHLKIHNVPGEEGSTRK